MEKAIVLCCQIISKMTKTNHTAMESKILNLIRYHIQGGEAKFAGSKTC